MKKLFAVKVFLSGSPACGKMVECSLSPIYVIAVSEFQIQHKASFPPQNAVIVTLPNANTLTARASNKR